MTDDSFDKKKHISVPWKPRDLRKGDRIVTSENPKTGAIVKTVLVKEVEHNPRGCPNKVHVNDDWCYDYEANNLKIALHPVAKKEVAAA